MSTVAPRPVHEYRGDPNYPTGDGKPRAETGLHLNLLMDLIQTLRDRLEGDPMAYAGGDMLLFYEEGNKRKHVEPDVFVTLGVPKEPERLNYIVWQEGKPPDVIIELTSKTTKDKDQATKLALYRDVLKIPEYFLFDPTQDYLRPSLQGFRLAGDAYERIAPIGGRLRCEALGLDLGREGQMLRLYDAATGQRLPTRAERIDQERRRAEQQQQRADQERERADQAAAENRRLLGEIEELRRRLGGS
ncbi:MAG: Uma2 family endonuclease [Isosphaeraceae bacterium]